MAQYISSRIGSKLQKVWFTSIVASTTFGGISGARWGLTDREPKPEMNTPSLIATKCLFGTTIGAFYGYGVGVLSPVLFPCALIGYGYYVSKNFSYSKL